MWADTKLYASTATVGWLSILSLSRHDIFMFRVVVVLGVRVAPRATRNRQESPGAARSRQEPARGVLADGPCGQSARTARAADPCGRSARTVLSDRPRGPSARSVAIGDAIRDALWVTRGRQEPPGVARRRQKPPYPTICLHRGPQLHPPHVLPPPFGQRSSARHAVKRV